MRFESAPLFHERIFQGFTGVYIQNDHFYVTVVPELGGRIMEFGSIGGDNCLYVFPDLQMKKQQFNQTLSFDKEQLKQFRMSTPPIHYGGHKNWISPQEVWEGRPFLDLELGTYTLTHLSTTDLEIGMELTSPVCRETGISFRRKLSIHKEDSFLTLEQSMTNHSDLDVCYGLWDVTQMNDPSRISYGINLELSKLPNGMKNFYEPGNIPHFIQCGADQIAIHYIKDSKSHKFGSDAALGWVKTESPNLGSRASVRKTFPFFEPGAFPHECSVEIYLFNGIPCVEVEILSPVMTIKPAQSIGFNETWSIAK